MVEQLAETMWIPELEEDDGAGTTETDESTKKFLEIQKRG